MLLLVEDDSMIAETVPNRRERAMPSTGQRTAAPPIFSLSNGVYDLVLPDLARRDGIEVLDITGALAALRP